MSKCTECKEYDKEKHYCPKWCDVIKDTIDDVRADEREKVLDEVDAILEGIVSGLECAMRVNPNLGVRDVVTSFVYTVKNVLRNYETKGEQT